MQGVGRDILRRRQLAWSRALTW